MGLPTYGEIIFVMLLGLIWGSFFNVCIVRLPKDESIVFLRSKCPHCSSLIPWYLNIPLFSYLWLHGRCAYCKARISIQYPLVELGTALLYLALYWQLGLGVRFFVYAIFASLLLVISVIDLYHQIIPDELSLSGLVLGFVASLFLEDVGWKSSLLGIVVGGGSFFAIAYLYEKLTQREGLGGGDVKLLAMIGAWLGLRSIFPVVILSSAIGSIVGLTVMAIQRKDFKTAIPFGPFLAIGALIYFFWAEPIYSFLFPQLTLL